MKIKSILTIFILTATSFTSFSQTKSTQSLHQKTHRALLAKAKSGMDKSTVKEMVEADILKRETNSTNQEIGNALNIMLDDLLSEARSHIGKKYVFGSKGPNTFDCSGFSGYVYRQFGYNIGASSRDQFTKGESIDLTHLRKGDLVFFTRPGSNSKTVGHVGIVLTADNESGTFTFIHSSTSRGVRIDSNTGSYSRRYVGAKRIINE